MTNRTLFKGVVNFIIKKEDKFLLFYRTDGYFKDGWWVLPAGHIETGETATHAVVRELKEELGIDVDPKDVKFVHCIHNLASLTNGFDFFFEINEYKGEIQNCEQEKCAEMKYLSLSELRELKNVVTTTRLALDSIENGISYSECLSFV